MLALIKTGKIGENIFNWPNCTNEVSCSNSPVADVFTWQLVKLDRLQ